MPAGWHIAQVNVAKMRAPHTDPIMAGFFTRVAIIEALADQSPGFVWRLHSPAGDEHLLQVFGDPLLSINMTVWETIEALFEFTYHSAHVEPYRMRREWFEKPDIPVYALWWVRAGTRPSPEEGKARLDLIQRIGPSSAAFTFKERYDPEQSPASF